MIDNEEDRVVTAKKLSIMEHFAKGGSIESSKKAGVNVEWADCFHPSWNWDHWDYRIKPDLIDRHKLLAELEAEQEAICVMLDDEDLDSGCRLDVMSAVENMLDIVRNFTNE